MQVLKSPVLSKSRHALLVLFHASLLARASCDVGQTACLAPPRPHAHAASARLRVGVEVRDRGRGRATTRAGVIEIWTRCLRCSGFPGVDLLPWRCSDTHPSCYSFIQAVRSQAHLLCPSRSCSSRLPHKASPFWGLLLLEGLSRWHRTGIGKPCPLAPLQ